MYYFHTTQRHAPISEPEDFDALSGDEYSELICAKPSLIMCLEEKHKRKLTNDDVINILISAPQLVGHFYTKLKSKRFKPNNWEYLTKHRSEFVHLRAMLER